MPSFKLKSGVTYDFSSADTYVFARLMYELHKKGLLDEKLLKKIVEARLDYTRARTPENEAKFSSACKRFMIKFHPDKVKMGREESLSQTYFEVFNKDRMIHGYITELSRDNHRKTMLSHTVPEFRTAYTIEPDQLIAEKIFSVVSSMIPDDFSKVSEEIKDPMLAFAAKMQHEDAKRRQQLVRDQITTEALRLLSDLVAMPRATATPAPDFEAERVRKAREESEHKRKEAEAKAEEHRKKMEELAKAAAKAHAEAVEKEARERKLREEAEKKHKEAEAKRKQEEELRARAEKLHKEAQAKREQEEADRKMAEDLHREYEEEARKAAAPPAPALSKEQRARNAMAGKSKLRRG